MKFLAAIFFSWLMCVSAFATDIPSRIEISYDVKTDIGDGEIKEVMDIKRYGADFSGCDFRDGEGAALVRST